jgi:hypothetical protein
MDTKLDDECLRKAADDEPLFILRAKDLLAPIIVDAWVKEAEVLPGPAHPKIIEARLQAERMRDWQADPAHRAGWPT